MARAWARKTPAGFEFAVKVWQKFTHARKIGAESGDAEETWGSPGQADADLFRKGIDPLTDAGKLGVLLFQYPPGFHHTEENLDRLRRTLKAFAGYPSVVELRHRSWSDQAARTKALLDQCGASWVLVDEPKFGSSVRQDFEAVGRIFYLRLHGRNREKWWSHAEAWERYDYLYSPQEIGDIAGKLKSIARSHAERSGKGFVFFNNHARGQAVANAIMLCHEMGAPVRARLGEGMLQRFPQISGLVERPEGGPDNLFP